MDRIEKLFSKLDDKTDCALITSDINRRYFTGMKSSAGCLAVFREKAYLLIDFRYIEKARNTVKNAEVIEQTDFINQLKELLEKHNAKNIAIEAETMTVKELSLYKSKLSEYSFIEDNNLSSAINLLRSVKDEKEIGYIKKAQEIAEYAFNEILKFIKVGVTEREIALKLDYLMLSNGAEAISFDTIALSGANTSMPHGVPSHKRVENGDFVLMDFGAVYNGYHSDMTRTVCVGEPTDEMVNVYNIVLSAQKKALSYAKAGITGSELDSVARNVIIESGFGACFGHSLGHGVGMEIHEAPNASSKSRYVFRENEVITIEPGIYIPGKFGVRIEDFVVLTKDSCVNLTKCEKNILFL
jgi:Xaa-Pro aminopeptidase